MLNENGTSGAGAEELKEPNLVDNVCPGCISETGSIEDLQEAFGDQWVGTQVAEIVRKCQKNQSWHGINHGHLSCGDVNDPIAELVNKHILWETEGNYYLTNFAMQKVMDAWPAN